MKPTMLVSLLSIACTAVVVAENSETGKQLQVYPKNLARQHLGANLLHFDAAKQAYVPTEASAAWLDDDITTGWPALAGKQYYLLTLPQPELITNFQLSTRPAAGTVTLYAGDEAAKPGSKAWSAVAKGVDLTSVNETKLEKPFSRVAKYLLIETDVADPGPVFSVYAYTDKPAVAYNLRQRDEAIDSQAVFGPFVNDRTAFNVAGLYAQSHVAYANSPDGFVSWQKMIDDNPGSGVVLAPSEGQSTMIVRSSNPQPINRVAAKVKTGAAGKLSVYLTKADAAPEATPPAVSTSAVSLADRIPTVVLNIDGANARTSVDFPEIEASEMILKWEPENSTDTLEVHELSAFGAPTLATYAVSMRPEAVAEYSSDAELLADNSKDGKSFVDGKTIADGKEAKDALEPIAAGPQAGPYLPGSLGFPPNLTGRAEIPRLPPDEVVSP